MEQLTYACSELLVQLEAAIASLTDDEFSIPSSALGGSTIGQHIRHTIEFFLCLERGLTSGVVNYDKRDRSPAIENDRRVALGTLSAVREWVESITTDKELLLVACYRSNTEDICRIGTSYYRELAYNLEHAVHHMAIIKIGIRDVAGHVELAPDFGVAASTSRFQGSGMEAFSH